MADYTKHHSQKMYNFATICTAIVTRNDSGFNKSYLYVELVLAIVFTIFICCTKQYYGSLADILHLNINRLIARVYLMLSYKECLMFYIIIHHSFL